MRSWETRGLQVAYVWTGMILTLNHASGLPHVPTHANTCFTDAFFLLHCTSLRESTDVEILVLEFRLNMRADLLPFSMYCHHGRTMFMPCEDHAE